MCSHLLPRSIAKCTCQRIHARQFCLDRMWIHKPSRALDLGRASGEPNHARWTRFAGNPVDNVHGSKLPCDETRLLQAAETHGDEPTKILEARYVGGSGLDALPSHALQAHLKQYHDPGPWTIRPWVFCLAVVASGSGRCPDAVQ